MSKPDRAAQIMAAWSRERPDLDPSSIAIVTRIWHLAHAFGIERRQLLSRQGIDPALMDLLGTLRRSGAPYALTTRQLAEFDGVTPAAISQRLTRAERQGWVSREPGEDRSVVVRLTDSGRRIVDETAGAIFAHEDRLLAVLDESERDTLAGLLHTLCLEHTGDLPVDHVGSGKPAPQE
ncbi:MULTISPECIES: MarR family winged helix-turn-helix transcriptional regulator [Prauserella salsuginis group]|uniref:DNA-binding MarR family transcriptional regulator n=2 Tax=Prauserella salsuginis group TaxID=2893672 RepID=A0A839XJ88_9PSEU|nr:MULTISPECIES: MarR family transcriptional regulator [Prauserella salsuginis group]MBB3664002.1 DNA-binding MarR family transcriptional regulator [Prauserella sediminis]